MAINPNNQNTYIDLDNRGQRPIVACEFAENNRALSPIISDNEFTLFRLDHNMPLMGVDYQADEFILNVNEHDYVSYTKGCFLGQEPVAKVHNRAKPSRKLVVAFEDECSPQEAAKMTSKAVDPQLGKAKGFVFISNK